MHYIADSGFIIALWEKIPARRAWARGLWERARRPLLTSACNLQEAGYLLDNHELVFRMVKLGDLLPVLDFARETERLHELLADYAPRMDLADAAIVRLSELHPAHTVLTVDHEDFTVYRRHKKRAIPCDFGPKI